MLLSWPEVARGTGAGGAADVSAGRVRTVTDFVMTHNVLGAVIALMSVICSGMQQILCRVMQQRHNLSSTEFLAIVAPAQVRILLFHHRGALLFFFPPTFLPSASDEGGSWGVVGGSSKGFGTFVRDVVGWATQSLSVMHTKQRLLL